MRASREGLMCTRENSWNRQQRPNARAPYCLRRVSPRKPGTHIRIQTNMNPNISPRQATQVIGLCALVWTIMAQSAWATAAAPPDTQSEEPTPECLQAANARMAEWTVREPAERRPIGALCRCAPRHETQEPLLDVRLAICARPWVQRYTQERALIEFTDLLTQELGWSLVEVKTMARCAGQMRADTLVEDVRRRQDPDLMHIWTDCARQAGHPDALLPLPIPKDLRMIIPGAR
jgi:hypothetical protein